MAVVGAIQTGLQSAWFDRLELALASSNSSHVLDSHCNPSSNSHVNHRDGWRN